MTGRQIRTPLIAQRFMQAVPGHQDQCDRGKFFCLLFFEEKQVSLEGLKMLQCPLPGAEPVNKSRLN